MADSSPSSPAPNSDATPPKRQPPPPIHAQPILCKGILSNISSSVPLEVKLSTTKDAGSGLFATQEIERGQEIFRSHPLVNCRDPAISDACDFCFANGKTTLHRDGRFLTANEETPTVKPCSGCKVARYCSVVSDESSPPGLTARSAADDQKGMSEEGVENLPQVRVQYGS